MKESQNIAKKQGVKGAKCETADADPMQHIVMWFLLLPLKAVIFFPLIIIMPLYTLIDWGTSPSNRHYDAFLLDHWKKAISIFSIWRN
jgi:hypothetical protein